MIERRPHWDDYLLASVMIHCNDIYQCYAVIAAVEDWQKKRWASITQSPMEVAVQFNALEAAIQRVRELPILGKAPQGNTALRGYNDGWNSCRMATLRALDGDSDD